MQPPQSLINELKNQQVATQQVTNQPEPVVTNVPEVKSNNPNQQQTATHNLNSIYPEATNGVLVSNTNQTEPINKQPHKFANDKLEKLIIIGVIALGIIIAVPALFSIIGWAKIISYGAISALGKAGVLIYTIDAIYLIVGIGLILRKELARITYVVIGTILLLIGLYGTINYFRESHSLSAAGTIYTIEANSEQKGINGNLAELNSYQNDTSIPAAQKQQIIAEIEYNLKQDQRQLQYYRQLEKQNSGINSLVKLIPTYLLAIIPLVFLTRPRVKEVFS